MILLANLPSRWSQRRERRTSGTRQWLPGQPRSHTQHIACRRDQNVHQPRLRQPAGARPPQRTPAHALRTRALDPCPVRILLLERLRSLPLLRTLQRCILRSLVNPQ
jgi:hypothetical protein